MRICLQILPIAISGQYSQDVFRKLVLIINYNVVLTNFFKNNYPQISE